MQRMPSRCQRGRTGEDKRNSHAAGNLPRRTSGSRGRDRGGDIGNRAEEDQRIVLRGREATPEPEGGRLVIYRIHDERTPADKRSSRHATLERVLDQPRPDTFALPPFIRRKLAEQQTRNRIGRLSGSDRSRQPAWHDGGWGKAVIAHHAVLLVDDDNRRKAILLVRQRPRLQPTVQHRLAAGELRYVMQRGDRLGSGEGQASFPGCRQILLPRGGTAQQFDHFRNSAGRS